MRHAITSLLAAAAVLLACGQAHAADVDAKAALALALACQTDVSAVKPACDCPPDCDCGCAKTGVCTCTYTWEETNKPNQVALYRGKVQVGNWWRAEQEFRRLECDDTGCRFVKCACPVMAPKPPSAPSQPQARSYVQPQEFSLPQRTWGGSGIAGGPTGGSC